MTFTSQSSLDGRRLILRGDASGRIGIGHLMRMLALAQAWLDLGGKAEAIVAEAPDALLERYAREGIDVRRLPAAHPDRRDLDAVVDSLDADLEARLVVDGPTFDGPYLDGLARAANRSLIIDDMAMLPRYPVALVLNQNAHAERSDYPTDDGPAYLLGLPYNLLRREFRAPRKPRRPVPSRARHILLTFGGADPSGMTARTLQALASLPEEVRGGLEVTAILGTATPAASVRSAVAAGTGLAVTVKRDVAEMIDWMAWADLTVTSGGTTVWELASVGTPALVVETSPAEHHLAGGLARVGLFDRLGPAADLDDRALAAAIVRRLDDVSWRTEMARLGPLLVDGHGPARVVAALAGVGAR
jgi:spore coat polysaccharide biosynthesis predicted glycosyltransferase SpsG